MKKLWVTGKNGILGSWFCQILQEKNIPFVATCKKQVNIESMSGIETFIEKERPTHIINCAAYTNVEKAEDEFEKAFNVNCMGIKNLAKASKHCKVVHFSTDYVFNGEKRTPYSEEDKVDPLNIYGKSKLEGEKALFTEKDDALCIRISWLFGGKNDFVSKMKTLFQTKEKLKIVSDQVGSPTFAKDVVNATLLLLDKSGLFHFSSSDSCSWYEFAIAIYKRERDLLCNEIKPIFSKDFPVKAKRPLYSVLDLSKIQKAGIKSKPFITGLEELLNG